MPRRNRRVPQPELPVILTSFLSDVQAEYSVTVTNGSGVQHLSMFGTQASVWAWVEVAAERGAFGPGHWYPSGITPLANVVSESPVPGHRLAAEARGGCAPYAAKHPGPLAPPSI